MRHLLNRAQLAAEASAGGARTLSKDFDTAMTRQRDLVYQLRNEIITGSLPTEQDLRQIAERVLASAGSGWGTRPALMRYIFDNLSYRLPADFDTLDVGDHRQVQGFLLETFARAVREKADLLADDGLYARFLTMIILKAIDVAWIEQVDFLEQLKTVVQDRNMAQHKVEYEYRREAFFAFEEMKRRIDRDIVRLLCLSRIERAADGGLIIQFA
jgi:preprotein translocase subunit SecA